MTIETLISDVARRCEVVPLDDAILLGEHVEVLGTLEEVCARIEQAITQAGARPRLQWRSEPRESHGACYARFVVKGSEP